MYNGSQCDDSSTPAIILLFIGFSNLDIEIGGGSYDIWETSGIIGVSGPLAGQPCATNCPNPDAANDQRAWNQPALDPNQQEMSLLRLAYPTVGSTTLAPGVVLFNGALGDQTLPKWDPAGFWSSQNNKCPATKQTGDGDCNYDRIAQQLQLNGFSALQVQAVFLKSANANPLYCLNTSLPCAAGSNQPDAYAAETSMGNIMRFLQKGYSTYPVPYPNLKQVFITSRTYGGYGVNARFTSQTYSPGCLNPEPFAYEESFAVQRLIVAQITGTPDQYSGAVDYSNAPWFDWAPYLWASGDTPRSDGLFWCGGQGDGRCSNTDFDVREGDLADETDYWGDYTHPSYTGLNKVSNLLYQWLNGNLNSAQSFMSNWVTPWAKAH